MSLCHPHLPSRLLCLVLLLPLAVATAADVTLAPGGQQAFSATVLDQFGDPLVSQPSVAWSASGGTVSPSSGASTTYTAGTTPGSYQITASSGALSANRGIAIVAPGTLPWIEDFALADGTTGDSGVTAWSVDTSATSGAIFEVRSGEFFSQDTDGEGVWRSQEIDISGASAVDLSLSIRGGGSLDAGADYLRIFYVLDGGSEVALADRDGPFNGGVAETVAATGLSGGTLRVVVRTHTTGGDESYIWDDVSIVAQTAANQPPVASATATPTTGTAPLTVGFDATGSSDSDGSIVAYSWTFGDGGSASGATPSHTYSAAGSYTATVTVSDDDGASASASVTITVDAPPSGDLPAPWIAEDIGNVAAAGSASHASGTFTVRGSGNDIWNNSDEFHFVHQPVSGDLTVVARVQSLQNTNSWAKAGVMIRDSTAATSTHAMCVQTPGNGMSFQRRTSAGSSSSHTKANSGTAPGWVRMERSGDQLTASVSENGSDWTTVGSVTIAMSDPVEIGLCVTSHNDGTVCEAIFTDVSVSSGGPSNQAPVVDAGGNQAITLPDDTVSLAGSASDPDADPLIIAWSKQSGPGNVVFSAAGSLSTSATFDASGVYVLQLSASDGSATSTDTVSITVNPEPAPSGVVFAANAGGGAFTASDGTAYAADTAVSGGKTYSTSASIGNTVDDTLYRSERYGNFSYAVDLPDGDYEVVLQFAEIYWTASGKRVFDVGIEGIQVIDDLDLFAVTGARYIAYDLTFPVTVSDGQLNVVFTTGTDNAKLSAIKVLAPALPAIAN